MNGALLVCLSLPQRKTVSRQVAKLKMEAADVSLEEEINLDNRMIPPRGMRIPFNPAAVIS